MQTKVKRTLVAVWIGMIFMISLIPNMVVCAAEDGSTLPQADLSKGITYKYTVYNGEQRPSGIYLNGNSVIIQESDNSTADVPLNNIIIDSNRNGVVDKGETMVNLDGSVDIRTDLAILGLYQESTTKPIVITINSGTIKELYGLNSAQSTVDGETAVKVTMNGGSVQSVLFCSLSSKIVTGNASAIEYTINGGTFGSSVSSAAAMSSDISSTGSQAIVSTINCTDVPANFWAANGTSIVAKDGGALKLSYSTTSEKTANVFGLYGCDVEVDGAERAAVEVCVKNGKIGAYSTLYNTPVEMKNSEGQAVLTQLEGGSYSSAQVLYKSDIQSDGTKAALVDTDVSNGSYSSFMGVICSTLNAGNEENTALDLDITGNPSFTGKVSFLSGLDTTNSNNTFRITGGVQVDMDFESKPETGTKINSIYAFEKNYIVNGDVAIHYNNAIINSSYGLYYCLVNGDFSYIFEDTCELYSSNYGTYYSSVAGAADMRMVGIPTNSYNYLYGFYYPYTDKEFLVGGDCEFSYAGKYANYLAAIYGRQNCIIGDDVTMTINGEEISSFYGIQYGSVKKNVTVNANIDSLKSNGAIAEYCNVQGDVTAKVVSAPSSVYKSANLEGVENSTVGGNVDVTYEGGTYSYVRATSNSSIGGNVNVTIDGVNRELAQIGSLGTSYVLNQGEVGGTATIRTMNSKFGYFYGCSNTKITKDIEVDVENIEASGNLYGASPVDVGGNVRVNMTDVKGQYLRGLYANGTIQGNVDVAITGAQNVYNLCGVYGSSSKVTVGDVNIYIKDCEVTSYGYGTDNLKGQGDITVTFDGGTYEGSYLNLYGMSSTNTTGNIQIDFKNCDIAGTVYPYSSYSSGSPAQVIANFSNVSIDSPGTGTVSVLNNVQAGQTVITTLDEQCEIGDKVSLVPSNSGAGTGIMTYQGKIYLGGKYRFDDSVEYKELHITSGDFMIPENVVVKVTDGIYLEGASVLVEGKLDGSFAGATNTDGKYTGTAFYMNGGTVTDDLSKVTSVYYPYDLEYDSMTCDVKQSSGYLSSSTWISDTRFLMKGNTIAYTVTPKAGYHMGQVVSYTEDKNNATEIIADNGLYKYVMGDSPAIVSVTCPGNTITVAKTIADPIAKLNQEYTVENPLYDLSTIYIRNDAPVGEVTFEIDDTQGLPEGLVLEGNKICGTPTKLYETGKTTVVYVIGKNGNRQKVNLNVVVTEGEGSQTSQDDRITIDEENSVVHLNGNAVVFEAENSSTAIYIDDNRDGVADFDTPVYVGDLTNYTVYGAKDAEVNTPILITVNSGTIGTLYGCENSTLAAKDNIIKIDIKGGKIAKLYGFASSTTQGTLWFSVNDNATVTSTSVLSGTNSYKGYYYRNKNTYNVYGEYTLTEDCTVGNLYVYGTLKIPADMTMSVTGTLYRYSNSYTIVEGVFDVAKVSTSSSYSGFVVVKDGGKIPEGNTWKNVYFPATVSTNLKNTSASFTTRYLTLVEDGETNYYLNADGNGSSGVQVTAASGYNVSYSVDGEEYVPIEDYKFSYPMPKKRVAISVKYEAAPITVSKRFADPVGVVGETYTEEEPLYDLNTFVISGDTTSTYGGNVVYSLKNGSKLPEGLNFENGYIVGTPTKAYESGKTVTFVVTGRNGYEVEVDVIISITKDATQSETINDVVTVSGSYIYLNGASVVILPDLSDSSKASIYLDRDHDKVADNSTPFIIGGNKSYSLANYTIYGYTDIDQPLDGDLSITMKGGNVKAIYGAKGGILGDAIINGNVTVDIEGGNVQQTESKVYGLYCAQAKNVTMNLTGGTHKYAEFVAAYDSTVEENVNYTVGGTTSITGSNSTSGKSNMYAADSSTVKGDVNLILGSDRDNISSYGYFYGVYNSNVQGNVNTKYRGTWAPNDNYLVRKSTIDKDLDVDWPTGTVSMTYYAYESTTIKGTLRVTIPADVTVVGNYNYLLTDSKAKNIRVNIGGTVYNQPGSFTALSGSSSVEESIVIKDGKSYTIGGKYVISQDLSATNMKLQNDAEVTIAKGVTVDLTPGIASGFVIPETAKLYNNGTLQILGTMNTQYIYGEMENNGEFTISTPLYVNGTLYNNNTMKTQNTFYVNGTFENAGTYTSKAIELTATGQIVNGENAAWTLGGRLNNKNVVVNYGTFNQTFSDSYFNYLGKIISSKPLQLYRSSTYYSSSNNSFYYACDVQYPTSHVDHVKVTGDKIISSGIAGDDRQYILADSQFVVELGTPLIEGVKPIEVIYGSQETAMIEQTNGTWAGTAPHEPMTIQVKYDDSAISNIELSKTSDRVENTDEYTPLVYNKTYRESNPLYDLRTIEILNDSGDGEVTYSVDSSSALPEGLILKGGRLYGTLESACDTEQEIVFVIQGKNKTSAFFTLTLGKINKIDPSFKAPTGLHTEIGKNLQDITLPDSTDGLYRWKDGTVSVGDVATTLDNVELEFVPNDTNNYDWAKLATEIGGTFENGVLTCKVSVEVRKLRPNYSVPTGIIATYGQTLKEVAIPSGNNEGTFAWKNPDAKVGTVSNYRYHDAVFTPSNTDRYAEETISIMITVVKAKAEFEPAISEVSQECGSTLGSIVLPKAENGVYEWITDDSVIPVDGEKYQVGFKPLDVNNYDWSEVPGWDSAWGRVVFPITVKINHVYQEEWTYDDESHWHKCLDEQCIVKNEKANHKWVAGEVLAKPSIHEAGSQQYNCLCGATKIVELPKIEHSEHTYSNQWLYDDTTHWQVCTLEECGQETTPENHTWDYSETIKEATETSTGMVKRICKCGKSVTEETATVPHTNHVYEEWNKNEEAHWRECTFEGCTYVTDKTPHNWTRSEVILSPTETSEGIREYTCACGATKRESIPKLPHENHKYSNLWQYDENYHWHECIVEDCDRKSNYAPHMWDDGVVTKEPTQTENGEKEYTCACGASKTTVVPMLGHTEHSYGEWNFDEETHWQVCTYEGCGETAHEEEHTWDEREILTPATETAEGTMQYSCKCGAKKTETIDKLPHTSHVYDDQWKWDYDTHWKVCTFDGCNQKSEIGEHKWTLKEVITKATELEEGKVLYECMCGMQKTEFTEKLEHTTHQFKATWSYDETSHWHDCANEDCTETANDASHIFGEAAIVVPATEDEEGIRMYTCKVCNYSYTQSYDLEDADDDTSLDVDEEFADKKTNCIFAVSVKDSEVEFVKFGKTSSKEQVIPNTITYEGVTYKVTSIADEAFKNHKSLKKITIPSNVKKIGNKAFYGCKKLTTVKVGKNVESIGTSAFQNCIALKKIEIPSKVKKIGKKAFYGCSKLMSITIKTKKLNTKNVGKDAFKKAGSSNYKKMVVKVPKSKLKAYKTTLKKRGLSSKAKIKK